MSLAEIVKGLYKPLQKALRPVALGVLLAYCGSAGSQRDYADASMDNVNQQPVPLPRGDEELSPESWIDIGVNNYYACGLRKNGGVACWGALRVGDRIEENMVERIIEGNGTQDHIELIGDYKFISESALCGILRNGEISCWYTGGDAVTKFPPGEYSYLGSSHDLHVKACAIRDDGTLVCPGYLILLECDNMVLPLPTGKFTEVEGYCGIRTDGRIQCFDEQYHWPENGRDYINNREPMPCSEKPRFSPPEGNFIQLEVAGNGNNCGLRENGTVACWESDGDYKGRAVEPSGRFRHISIDDSGEGVGIREDGTLEYWSQYPLRDGEKSYSHVPEGRFVRVASDGGDACAIREGNQSVVCWGVKKRFMSPYE